MKKIIVKKNEIQMALSIVEENEFELAMQGLINEYPDCEIIVSTTELEECYKNRMAEYPGIEDFLNAYFDGGEFAVQELQNMRLAVKAKYPKPSPI